MSGKYCQSLLDHAKQSAADSLKTSWKRVIQRTARTTDDLVGNEIANKTTKTSRTLRQNNSETTPNENVKEISKERYISLKER